MAKGLSCWDKVGNEQIMNVEELEDQRKNNLDLKRPPKSFECICNICYSWVHFSPDEKSISFTNLACCVTRNGNQLKV